MEELLKVVEEITKRHEVLLLMACGSRIHGNATEKSDLDIFIVSENRKYISVKRINGIKVEMHCFPIEEVKRKVRLGEFSGDTYFESVLKTGKVLKNKYNTYEELLYLLEHQVKKKRVINRTQMERLEDSVTSFLYKEDQYKDNYYFFSLELIRRLFHVKENASTISSGKVYNLYKNPKIAEELYRLKLPNEEFRESYLRFLNETSKEKQKIILTSFLKEFQNCESRRFSENLFLSNQEIKQKLLAIHNKVEKCKEFILKHHPYANAFYNIVIYEMFLFRRQLEVDEERIEVIYERAVLTYDDMQRIFVLEELFGTLGSRYSMDYDDFYRYVQEYKSSIKN